MYNFVLIFSRWHYTMNFHLNLKSETVCMNRISFNNYITSIKTIFRKSLNKSDISRWRHTSSLHPSWDERTILISKLIPPNSSILEFGAGKMTLKKHVEDNCSYTPSDFVDRGGNQLIYDLNAPKLSSFSDKYDVSVFSGMECLEY